MNSRTSVRSVLLDWICLLVLSFVRARRDREIERIEGRERHEEAKRKTQEREKDERSLTLPDAHLPQRRDKRGLQETRGSKITLLCLHLTFFHFPVHLHG